MTGFTGATGLEPAISGLTGRRDKPASPRPRVVNRRGRDYKDEALSRCQEGRMIAPDFSSFRVQGRGRDLEEGARIRRAVRHGDGAFDHRVAEITNRRIVPYSRQGRAKGFGYDPYEDTLAGPGASLFLLLGGVDRSRGGQPKGAPTWLRERPIDRKKPPSPWEGPPRRRAPRARPGPWSVSTPKWHQGNLSLFFGMVTGGQDEARGGDVRDRP